ncbi:MAG: hypothetical protein SOV27_00970 [Eubacteriales bacterium]|nr:hypothetical protein [Eubacteriales bacterium]
MRSVLNEEMDVVWDNYEKRIKELGFKNMMLSSQRDLMNYFTLNFKNLYYQVKYKNQDLGKSRVEVRYSILKLRRLVALWVKSNVWAVDGGINYSANDKRREFPLFRCQRPNIIPMPKTIKRMQAKCLHQFIEDYNANYVKNVQQGKSKTPYIRNLRDLRNVLMTHADMNEIEANQIIKLYGSVVAKKEVNDFSNEGIDLK